MSWLSFRGARDSRADTHSARESKSADTPRATPEQHPYHIHDFFAFRGVLFGRGIVEHQPGNRPKLAIRLPDGTTCTADYSLDPIHASTEHRTCFSLRTPLPEGLNGEAVAAIALFIYFKDSHLEIEKPSAQALSADRFLASEAVFWSHIHSLSSGRVLEVGSRARSSITRRSLFPPCLDYVGLDIAPGPNVDVVGDAHTLSAYFPDEHFDAVFSVSVWEHLAMPWKVSLELNRVLKTRGLAMINTHQAWPSHEEPWDYFRFSEYSWASLFNAATGFELVACGQGSPAVMASAFAVPHLQNQQIELHYGYLASRCVVRKIGATALSWPVDLKLVSGQQYSY